MDNKVIPFPAQTPEVPSPGSRPGHRIVVRIGRQRVAFDISCQATVLDDAPGLPVVPLRKSSEGKRQGRQDRRQ